MRGVDSLVACVVWRAVAGIMTSSAVLHQLEILQNKTGNIQALAPETNNQTLAFACNRFSVLERRITRTMSHCSFSRFLLVDVAPLPLALLPSLSVYRYCAVPRHLSRKWQLRAGRAQFESESYNGQA